MRIGGVFLLEPISPADWDSVAHFWLLFFIWPKRCSITIILSLLSGVALFLFGMSLMGDGLIFLQKYPIMEMNFIREDYL